MTEQLKPSMENTSGAVVVTGVSSGIGEAITSHLLQSGYQVFGSVRKPEDADRLRESLGDQFVPMLFDVRDTDAIQSEAEQVKTSLDGRTLSALVNNAGLATFGPMELLDDKEFSDIIAVNLIGVRSVTNAFLPMLRKPLNQQGDKEIQQAGKIINISSLSGIVNTPMNGAYCVSKHALESLGEIYRRELLSSGIKVFSIRPGPIQSQIWGKNSQELPPYENPDYQRMRKNAEAIIEDAVKSAIPASVIADLVKGIIEEKKRKLSYEVGRGALGAKILSACIPARLADRLLHRAIMK